MSRPALGVAAAGFVVAVALAAAAAPLWVYAISLACFGLPHVLVELRYVDQRFAARLPRWTIWWLGGGLATVAALRLLASVGVHGYSARTELALGVGLVAVVVPVLASRAGPVTTALVLGVAALLVHGVVYAPLTTLVVFALLHNLTPVGFLAERLRGRTRLGALVVAAVVFGAVPALMLLAPFVPPVTDGPFATGDLTLHLHAFVPDALRGGAFGERLFAAAAYLQVMHHAVVLTVLPRLGGGDEARAAVLPWPGSKVLAAAMVAIACAALLSFAVDFGSARAGYGVLAAVHAWLEIPVLLLALSVGAVGASATAARREVVAA